MLLFYSTPHTISLNHHRISCSQCAKAFGVDHKQGCMTEYQARLLGFPKDNVDRGFNSVGRIEGISEIFTLKIVAINSMVIPSFFSLLKNLLETCRFTYFSAFINRLFPHTLQVHKDSIIIISVVRLTSDQPVQADRYLSPAKVSLRHVKWDLCGFHQIGLSLGSTKALKLSHYVSHAVALTLTRDEMAPTNEAHCWGFSSSLFNQNFDYILFNR